jgi:hypothetical protein
MQGNRNASGARSCTTAALVHWDAARGVRVIMGVANVEPYVGLCHWPGH